MSTPRFQFTIKQVMLATFFFAAALAILSVLVNRQPRGAVGEYENDWASIYWILIGIPAAITLFGAGVGVLFNRTTRGLTLGMLCGLMFWILLCFVSLGG